MTYTNKALSLINTFANGDVKRAGEQVAFDIFRFDEEGKIAEQNIQMIYTTVHQVLAQGNYVLAVSEGTLGGAPTSYYDLWRVDSCSYCSISG